MDSTGEPVPTDPAHQLIDQPLAEEIELLGEVVAAAAAAEDVMTDPEIDEALGVSPGDEDPPPAE